MPKLNRDSAINAWMRLCKFAKCRLGEDGHNCALMTSDTCGALERRVQSRHLSNMRPGRARCDATPINDHAQATRENKIYLVVVCPLLDQHLPGHQFLQRDDL